MALVMMLIIVIVTSGSESQITFSRDWLAGSGKRSAAPVNFSRDWLTSGKRSGTNFGTNDRDVFIQKIIHDILHGLEMELETNN